MPKNVLARMVEHRNLGAAHDVSRSIARVYRGVPGMFNPDGGRKCVDTINAVRPRI